VKVTLQGQRTEGRVTGIFTSVSFVNEVGDTTTYDGAIEVEGLGGIFAVPGDSGSLVVDRHNHAVGIVVGEADGRVYLAPLEHTNIFTGLRFVTARDELAFEARSFARRNREEPLNLGFPLAA
jgi:hypothetical protein